VKTQYKVALAMLAGTALGGLAVQGLHAQAKPPGYAIVDLSEITNPTRFKEEVLTKGPKSAAAGGGTFIIRNDKITPTDGTPPIRFVVIKFDSLEKAQAWAKSSAQQEVDKIRGETTKSRQFLVEGLPQ
jgi:uncharacterized protein (DUF1330 family)